MKPNVVITFDRRWNYFQWFILGFFILKSKKQISLHFKTNVFCKASFICPSSRLNKLFRRIYFKQQRDSYYLDGYIEMVGKCKKTFTIDCSDTPYMFDYTRLKNVDIYFKIQCPIDLESDNFELTSTVKIPWIDSEDLEPKLRRKIKQTSRNVISNFNEYTYKIKPLMLGPRELAVGNSYSELKRQYDKDVSSFTDKKDKKGMCYFGDSKGPMPSENIIEPDLGLEYDLMGWYKDELSHPNEKRAQIAKYLTDLGADYDARIINEGNADKGEKSHPELVVPLSDFEQYVSRFQYNFNVSGFTMSIPSRFIDSFMVGTAVVTDKLKCKWFMPFDNSEVIETVEMGYNKEENVDWEKYYAQIKELPDTEPNKIKQLYLKKWAPDVVANYIVDTVINA